MLPKTHPASWPWTPSAPQPRKAQPDHRPPRHHLSQVVAATHTSAAATTRIWVGAPRSAASKAPAPGAPRSAAKEGEGGRTTETPHAGGRKQSPWTGRRPSPPTQKAAPRDARLQRAGRRRPAAAYAARPLAGDATGGAEGRKAALGLAPKVARGSDSGAGGSSSVFFSLHVDSNINPP